MADKILICCEGNKSRGFGHVMRSSMLALTLKMECSWYWANSKGGSDKGENSKKGARAYPAFVKQRVNLLAERSQLSNTTDPSVYDLVVVDGVLSQRLRHIQLSAQQQRKAVVSISPDYKWNEDVDVIINRFPLKRLGKPVMYCGSNYFIPGKDLDVLRRIIDHRAKWVKPITEKITLVACFGGGVRRDYIKRLFLLVKELPTSLVENLELFVVDPCNSRIHTIEPLFMPIEPRNISPKIKGYTVQKFEDALAHACKGSKLVVLCSAGVFAYEVALLSIPFAVIDHEECLRRLMPLETNSTLVAYGTLEEAKQTVVRLLSHSQKVKFESEKEPSIHWAETIENILKAHL